MRSLRGDVYGVDGFDNGLNGSEEFATEVKGDNGAILRGNAIAGIEYRYPFIASTGSITHVVEPIGQIIARPELGGRSARDPERGRSEPRV